MSEQATASRPEARASRRKGSSDPSAAIATISYEDLYRRWEQGNWKATAIDFSQDKDGWRSLTDFLLGKVGTERLTCGDRLEHTLRLEGSGVKRNVTDFTQTQPQNPR